MKSECSNSSTNTIFLTHNRVISEARRRFELYTSGTDKSAIHPNLRGAIFGTAMRHGDTAEYEALKKEWYTTLSIDGKEIALRAMGRIQNTKLLPDYLTFIFTDVATQDVHTSAMALAANPKTRKLWWKHIQDNFESIYSSLSNNFVLLDRFVKVSLQKFNDRETEKEIKAFFEGRDNRGYDRTLGVVSDTILGRAAYKERDASVILEWLETHGYA